jgi:RNA polymerase sigma-70 factor (ECF subfamily)
MHRRFRVSPRSSFEKVRRGVNAKAHHPQLIDESRFATFGTMPDCSPEQVRQSLEVLYRSDSGRILAALVRLLEDLDLAEDAMQEAFSAALNVWQKTGNPENPRPWLISTAQFKAIDAMRRRARFAASQQDLILHLEAQSAKSSQEEENIEDDGCA